MTGKLVLGIFICITFLALGDHANAQTTITCTNSAASDQAAWSTALGGSTYPSLSSGGVVQITGICAGDYVFKSSFIRFQNHTASGAVSSSDGFNGMVEFIGTQRITINGLTLEGNSLVPSTTSTATGVSTFLENGNLVLHDDAGVVLENSQVGPGTVDGIIVLGSSSISIINTTISGNGTSNAGISLTDGIYASNGSSVRLGSPNGTNASTITGNGPSGGGCPGFGILLEQSTGLVGYAAAIGTSGSPNTCGQIFLETGSSARLQSVSITQTSAQTVPAVNVTGGSSILTEPNGVSAGTSSITGASGGAVLLGAASVGVFNSATLTATGNSGGPAVVEASGSSNLILAGDNTITNATSGGIAIQIDHSSSMLHLQGSHFGYPNQVETVTGAGVVQEQSSMDLGQGTISSSPSISWGTGSGGISVQQNSSFRVSGGVSITGAATISQGSNGFANTANGGTNAITSASCPFTNVPSSHWASPNKVSPAVPSATSYSSAVSPQCLAF